MWIAVDFQIVQLIDALDDWLTLGDATEVDLGTVEKESKPQDQSDGLGDEVELDQASSVHVIMFHDGGPETNWMIIISRELFSEYSFQL